GPTAIDQHMSIDAGYGGLFRTSWSGEIYSDWVAPAGVSPAVRMSFGAITDQTNFLVGTCAGGMQQGVLGFAQAPMALPDTVGFFDQVVEAGTVPNVFAIRFCDTEGTLWLGGYDP